MHPDAARAAAFRRVYERHLVVEDIYPALAARIARDGCRRFCELGGGRGPITALLAARGIDASVVDRDEQMVAEASRPAMRGDLRMLPLRSGAFDAAAAINCLYFLPDARTGLREAKRVLRPGGLLVASCPARENDPELRDIDPDWGAPSSFDAEDAPAIVADVLDVIEVEPWRVVAYILPDRDAVADYLHAFNIPNWGHAANRVEVPLSITKVGAHVWARA